LTYLVMYM